MFSRLAPFARLALCSRLALFALLALQGSALAASEFHAVGGDFLAASSGGDWSQIVDVVSTNDRTFDGRTFYVLKKPGTAVEGFTAKPSPFPLKTGRGQWLEVDLDKRTYMPVGTDDIGFHPERRLDDGSLILRRIDYQREQVLRQDAKGALRRYPVTECSGLWTFLGDGSYLRIDRGRCLNLPNHTPFEGGVDGHPAQLYYAKDGVHEKSLATAQMMATPRFVAGGSHAVVWVTAELKDGQPVGWDLLDLELATGKSKVVGSYVSKGIYDRAVYLAGKGEGVQDPGGFFAAWERQPWVLYFPRREQPGVLQGVALHDVLTGEEKRFDLPAPRYYLPAPGMAELTVVTLDESGDTKSLKAWELPSLKLLGSAPFPPRGAPPTAGSKLRDSLIKAYYAP